MPGVTITPANSLAYMIEYEGGNLTVEEYLSLFAHLIRTKRAWSLQGMYGREAARLIESGLISKSGRVQWKEAERQGIDIKQDLYNE